MIEVQQLTKRFEAVTAVKDLSFKIDTGETLALIGTSGSGKTTTLKMINRLIEPTAGKIIVEGEEVQELPVVELRRRMGYVIQETGLFTHYTVEENVGVVPRLLGWDKARIRERTQALLEQLGLSSEQFAGSYPGQLSGGQQQRVGIARALAADPPIVLMDEPFGALDPITRGDIRRDFMELEELKNKTTILVTHDVEEAFEMADWVCLLDEGRMQQIGTPAELLFEPANDFVVDFLAEQRLQLEMEVIALEDLFDSLPESPPDGGKEQSFSLTTSVRQVIATLSSAPGHDLTGMVERDDQYRYFDLPGLMQQFFQYQKNL